MARKKTCPECAERIQAGAHVCRHCGYRFDEPAPAAPAVSASTPASTVTEPRTQPNPPATGEPLFEKDPERNEDARRIIFALVSILGGLGLAFGERDCGDSITVGSALGNILGVALTGCLYALIGMLFQRLRKRPVNFKNSLRSYWVIGFLAFSALASAGQRNANHNDKCDKSSTPVSALAPTAVPLGKKLLGESGVSRPDRRLEARFYIANNRMDRTLTTLIAAYNDDSVSTDSFLGQVDGAQSELNTDLNTLNQGAGEIGDPKIKQFWAPLPLARNAEVQGINGIAAALRNGTNADLAQGRQQLNSGVKQALDWTKQFRAAIAPYR